jgi:hypothetical protein
MRTVTLSPFDSCIDIGAGKRVRAAVLLLSLLPCAPAVAADPAFGKFFGQYQGRSDTIPAGEKEPRELSVTIGPYKKNGFTIEWKTRLHKADGRVKQSGLSVNFISTHRSNVFASAMRTDLFGHQVPLDPLKGDPFVWVTTRGETLTLYVIRIADNGEQDLQIDELTRMPQGLHLKFTGFYGSEPVRRLTATLKKTDASEERGGQAPLSEADRVAGVSSVNRSLRVPVRQSSRNRVSTLSSVCPYLPAGAWANTITRIVRH